MLTEATYKYCNCRSPENPARSMMKIELLLRYLQEKKQLMFLQSKSFH